MTLHEPSRRLAKAFSGALASPKRGPQPSLRRNASSQSSESLQDPLTEVVPDSSFEGSVPESVVESYHPVARARARKNELPPSRYVLSGYFPFSFWWSLLTIHGSYQYRSPKYDRGPLHPHRPPPPSDPSSRLFVPGPFTLPRVQQTYDTTIAQDILTLCYVHKPPGFNLPPRSPRLRPWDDSSPYHKNRPFRGPRGGDVLRLLRKPITFNNIPKLERITVHSYIKHAAMEGSQWLHVAGMAVQAISNVRVETFKSKSSVSPWGIAPGRDTVAVKAELLGENMYHFIGKLVDVVMPKIKEWKGIKGSSGDSSGNITFGLVPEAVALFPEIEINYDM
jgi:large subunit ribosomal protein L5